MNHVKWQALSEYFRQRRGEGLGYKTIQAWMVYGMPHTQPSKHRLFFDCEACWQWYLDYFHMERAG